MSVTAQGQPLYTEGMHAGKGRAETVTSDDFKSALQSVKDSEADGAVVFTWSDFLHKEYDEHDGTMVKIVHELFGE